MAKLVSSEDSSFAKLISKLVPKAKKAATSMSLGSFLVVPLPDGKITCRSDDADEAISLKLKEYPLDVLKRWRPRPEAISA